LAFQPSFATRNFRWTSNGIGPDPRYQFPETGIELRRNTGPKLIQCDPRTMLSRYGTVGRARSREPPGRVEIWWSEMRDNVIGGNDMIDAWIEAFGMTLNDEGLYHWTTCCGDGRETARGYRGTTTDCRT
jgi:hypothetical protein